MPDPGPSRAPRLAFLAAFVLALVLAAYTRHVWEDYYITYRSSKNLATGHGLVFNVGDRLHTFTSPLGVLLPAAACLLTFNASDDAALWVFRLMGAAALGGAAALLVVIARRLAYPAVAVAFLAALLCTDIKSVDFAINGMETPFLLLFVAYGLWSLVTPGPRRAWHLGAAWAGLMWTRPDSFLYIGFLAAGAWLFNQPDRTGARRGELLGVFLRAGLVTVALYGPWFAWAWWYYGSPVPHTIVAKAAQGEGLALPQLLHGWWRLPAMILRGETFADGIFLPAYYQFPSWPAWLAPYSRGLAALATVLWLVPGLRWETRTASFACYGGACYLCFVPYFPFPWYFPTVTLLAGVALAGLVAQAWSAGGPAFVRWPLRALCTAGMALILVAATWLGVQAARQLKAQQFYVEDSNRRVIGEWLRAHAAPGDTVFMEPLGYIGFFSGLKTYDWPGMSSREVVAAARLVGRNWDDIIAYLQPTWVVVRDNAGGDLAQIAPTLAASNYERVQVFDQTEAIKRVDVHGRGLLEFDERFVLHHLKHPTRRDADGCEIASPFGSNPDTIDGQPVRMVHAPGLMVVDVPAGATGVAGEFGYPPNVLGGNVRTDGAEFKIFWSDGRTRRQLFAQALHPEEAVADRGLHGYDLALPRSHGRAVRLVFVTAPGASSAKDWTCWSKPRFR